MSNHPPTVLSRVKNTASSFAEGETAGGLVLLAAAAGAMLIANSPVDWLYGALLGTPVSIRVGALLIDKALLFWINDGLMAIFFFLVGLEIKREIMIGELSTPKQAALPAIAALGGMAAPALIYAAINWQNAAALDGWAIPAATDIAFAVGVLSLVGPRAPSALKVFLLALAIIDDLGAIIIIALFYTSKLSAPALLLAAAGVAALVVLNRAGVRRIAPYALVGLFMWVCVLKSGVHATVAGVLTALAVPLEPRSADEPSPLEHLEHELHPWVAFGVLPLFAFANAGVSLSGFALHQLFGSITLGIAFGLLVGKPIGIFAATYLAVLGGLGTPPEGASWRQVLGVSMLGGIGFTMSLFIGALAFPGSEHAAEIRLGVLFGSILSALAGYLLLATRGRAPLPPDRS